MIANPFILHGYVSDDLFCDRVAETGIIREHLENGRNVALMAQRRMGKTGLISHFFHQKDIQQCYYTFLVDIYATKSLQEMVNVLGKEILSALKPFGRKVLELFMDCLRSVRSGISFDQYGNPTWNVELGDIQNPEVTLDEIFRYLEMADKPCLVAIDEFQAICMYPGKSVEALLRTKIQRCHNAYFVFSGSQRTMMTEMFLSHSRPFYQSTALQHIGAIDLSVYTEFAIRLFKEGSRVLYADVVEEIYSMFDGVTWYLQRILNKLYVLTTEGGECKKELVPVAITRILDESAFAYEALLYQLPAKQKELFRAICKEGKARNLMSEEFIRRHRLASASSIQSAIKGLLDKDFITRHDDYYESYDFFFRLWLLRQ